jgi:hypothetical protein
MVLWSSDAFLVIYNYSLKLSLLEKNVAEMFMDLQVNLMFELAVKSCGQIW